MIPIPQTEMNTKDEGWMWEMWNMNLLRRRLISRGVRAMKAESGCWSWSMIDLHCESERLCGLSGKWEKWKSEEKFRISIRVELFSLLEIPSQPPSTLIRLGRFSGKGLPHAGSAFSYLTLSRSNFAISDSWKSIFLWKLTKKSNFFNFPNVISDIQNENVYLFEIKFERYEILTFICRTPPEHTHSPWRPPIQSWRNGKGMSVI